MDTIRGHYSLSMFKSFPPSVDISRMNSLASIASPRAQLGHQISMRMLEKTQDVARSQGQAAISMLDQANEMQREMAAQSGKGVSLDVTG